MGSFIKENNMQVELTRIHDCLKSAGSLWSSAKKSQQISLVVKVLLYVIILS